MKLQDLKAKKGSRRKTRIVGRGTGSGHGKTCTRGNNGQGQRAGKGHRPGFEGGQPHFIGDFLNFKPMKDPINLSGKSLI